MNLPGWIAADLPAGCGVYGGTTTRVGGVSEGSYQSRNLATHVGDDRAAVIENRRRLREALELPAEPLWLDQCHGTRVAMPDDDTATGVPDATDAAVTAVSGRVLAVLTADCLPVLLVAPQHKVIGIAHAGWRGLAAGVLENTLTQMAVPAKDLHAWLGPAIGPANFEVGQDVRRAFTGVDDETAACFQSCAKNKWLADLPGLAERRLGRLGVASVTRSGLCTYGDSERFFSFRRDGECGRMASLLWLAA